MIRPWQILTAYLVCVGLALAVMAAVTRDALQLDRAEQESRLRAELEERVGGALWTMDAEVSALLAEELARPPREFADEHLSLSKGQAAPEPPKVEPPGSEPSSSPDELVLVRFRVDIDNVWRSPQCPTVTKGLAGDAGGSDERAAMIFEEIQKQVDFRQLAMTLPLPTDVRDRLALADSLPLQGQQLVNNAYLPQQTALRNDNNMRRQFGPNAEGIAQQQQEALPQQMAEAQTSANDYANAIVPNRLARRGGPSQQLARNTLIIRRLEAVQAILAADRAALDERWSNTVWIGGHLVLARMTIENNSALILGACLDWDRLRERLKVRVGDALGEFDLEPIVDENELLKHRALATLPVRVVTPPIDEAEFEGWTPIRVTMGLAWAFLSMAALAVGALLIGAVRLSERRASFVAAVTHELRSPLTTFQLYTEMLLGGMVPKSDETTYLQTLRAESERLSHLVENVLQYSRIERGKQPSCDQRVTVAQLMERTSVRLAERLRQAGMELEIVDRSEGVEIKTDPAAVEQILYNLIDNASKYAACGKPKLLRLEWLVDSQRLVCHARDFGPGIDAAGQRQLFRAFSKSVHEAAESAPGVGLGLALCQRLAAQLGGSLRYREPVDGEGGACFELDLGPVV